MGMVGEVMKVMGGSVTLHQEWRGSMRNRYGLRCYRDG